MNLSEARKGLPETTYLCDPLEWATARQTAARMQIQGRINPTVARDGKVLFELPLRRHKRLTDHTDESSQQSIAHHSTHIHIFEIIESLSGLCGVRIWAWFYHSCCCVCVLVSVVLAVLQIPCLSVPFASVGA